VAGGEAVQLAPGTTIVLDTNIVLDLVVFQDPATQNLRHALELGDLAWIATQAMRDELERVLDYPQIVKSLRHHGGDKAEVLSYWDRWVKPVEAATKAPVTCKDPDDQKFIDLAVAHQARLLSKDHAVLCMAKRLAGLGVAVRTAL
jgi:putative PIN family toxin of toxin-antitoxin system